MTFAELVASACPYLRIFDSAHYPDCFQRFEADAGSLFDALSEENSQALAAALVADLAEQRSCLSRRAQRDMAYQQKRVLCLFLTPAAQRHSQKARIFAEELRALWCEQQPRNTYLAGTYEQIMSGFDFTLLGMHIRKDSI